MTIRPLITVGVCLVALTAQAQTKLLFLKTNLIDKQYTFGRNVAAPPELMQRVLTMDADRRGIMGLGPKQSVIRAAASVTDSFIKTDNLGNYDPDVGDDRFAFVDSITVDGQRFAYQGTNPHASPIANGIELHGDSPIVQNVHVKNFWGSALVLREVNRVRNNVVVNSFTGIKVISSDCQITDNLVAGCRDYGIWHASGGHITTQGNHYFGFQKAAALLEESGQGGFDSVNDSYADAPIGMDCGTNFTSLTNCIFFHNRDRGIKVDAPNFHATGTKIYVQNKVDETTDDCVGLELTSNAARSSFMGGSIQLLAYHHPNFETNPIAADAAIRVAADQCVIKTTLVDFDSASGSTGIHIPSGVKSLEIDVQAYGFEQSNERILKIDSDSVEDLDIVIRKDFANMANPGTESAGISKYVDIEAGWKGSIKLIDIRDDSSNANDGGTVELVEEDPY